MRGFIVYSFITLDLKSKARCFMWSLVILETKGREKAETILPKGKEQTTKKLLFRRLFSSRWQLQLWHGHIQQQHATSTIKAADKLKGVFSRATSKNYFHTYFLNR